MLAHSSDTLSLLPPVPPAAPPNPQPGLPRRRPEAARAGPGAAAAGADGASRGGQRHRGGCAQKVHPHMPHTRRCGGGGRGGGGGGRVRPSRQAAGAATVRVHSRRSAPLSLFRPASPPPRWPLAPCDCPLVAVWPPFLGVLLQATCCRCQSSPPAGSSRCAGAGGRPLTCVCACAQMCGGEEGKGNNAPLAGCCLPHTSATIAFGEYW